MALVPAAVELVGSITAIINGHSDIGAVGNSNFTQRLIKMIVMLEIAATKNYRPRYSPFSKCSNALLQYSNRICNSATIKIVHFPLAAGSIPPIVVLKYLPAWM